MPQSAEEVYARVVAQVGPDGHLPMPALAGWDIFPWEGDGLRPRVLEPPLDAEPPRAGEDGRPCRCASGEPEHAIWRNDRWTVASTGAPSGMPLVLLLESREHLDFDELDDDLASEFGRVTSWLHRIMARLEHVGRVHVNKWGDGGAHLHVTFVARTARLPHVLGSTAVEWDDVLPPAPEEVWRADLRHVAQRLALHDGVALV
jgi:diadenosine tetraphosphate (Ap4A) HIT family hydrolase